MTASRINQNIKLIRVRKESDTDEKTSHQVQDVHSVFESQFNFPVTTARLQTQTETPTPATPGSAAALRRPTDMSGTASAGPFSPRTRHPRCAPLAETGSKVAAGQHAVYMSRCSEGQLQWLINHRTPNHRTLGLLV